MTGLTLPILGFAAVGVSLAALFYLRDEVEVRGRSLLLGARIATLLILALLLLDPHLPGADAARGGGEDERWVLLDPDLSLTLVSDAERTLWDDGLGRAADEARLGARLALATPGGRGPEGVDTTSLRTRVPDHPPGDLAQGILRLGESGADSILILSSFRLPPEELARIAEITPVPLSFERLGGPSRNAGVGELTLPAFSPPGEEVELQVTIFAEGGFLGDSIDLEVAANGQPVQAERLPVPAAGTERSYDLVLPPPPLGAALVRYTARVTLDGDAFGVDDERADWVTVGEGEQGILLLSLRPDWEPRVLLPLLEAVTGLDGDGYLALGGERYLPLSEGSEGVEIVGAEAFRDRIPRARILVLDGGAAQIAGWMDALVRSHPRVLHLPDDPTGTALVGLQVDDAWEGEWVLEPEIPASPISPFLSGVQLAGLPPLASILPVTSQARMTIALTARRAQVGDPLPILALRETPAGRRAVVLADGLWRWAGRDGNSRDVYRGIWGGVTDWILSARDPVARTLVAPAERTIERGAPLQWEIAPEAAGSILSLQRIDVDPTGQWDGSATPEVDPEFRGPLVPGEDGVATTPSVAPGIYRYEVRSTGEATGGVLQVAGVVEVEGWAPSLRRLPLEVAGLALPAAISLDPEVGEGGRPLRTHPLPYLLLLFLLCAEWLGRRAVGLR